MKKERIAKIQDELLFVVLSQSLVGKRGRWNSVFTRDVVVREDTPFLAPEDPFFFIEYPAKRLCFAIDLFSYSN